MKGTVVGIDRRKGFFALRTHGGITVAEIVGSGDIEMNDLISGNLESEGSEIFFNETKGEKIYAFVQGVHCTPEFASKLLEAT